MSVSNVDEVLGSAEEFVRKNSEEPSRTMNSKECPECEARGTFQGSEEFFLTNSEADPRTEATLLTDVVQGFCLPPRVSRFSSRHAYLQKSQDLNTLQKNRVYNTFLFFERSECP